MAFCINCGEKLDDGAKFCMKCGAAISAVQERVLSATENTPPGAFGSVTPDQMKANAMEGLADMARQEMAASYRSETPVPPALPVTSISQLVLGVWNIKTFVAIALSVGICSLRYIPVSISGLWALGLGDNVWRIPVMLVCSFFGMLPTVCIALIAAAMFVLKFHVIRGFYFITQEIVFTLFLCSMLFQKIQIRKGVFSIKQGVLYFLTIIIGEIIARFVVPAIGIPGFNLKGQFDQYFRNFFGYYIWRLLICFIGIVILALIARYYRKKQGV